MSMRTVLHSAGVGEKEQKTKTNDRSHILRGLMQTKSISILILLLGCRVVPYRSAGLFARQFTLYNIDIIRVRVCVFMCSWSTVVAADAKLLMLFTIFA